MRSTRAATSPPGFLTRPRKPPPIAQGIAYFVLAAAPVACGAALAVLEPPILLMVLPALVIAVTVSLVSWSGRGALRAEHATAAVLVALGVVAVTWNGVRGPGEIGPSDILLGGAFVALGFSSLRGGRLPVLPGWLLLAGAALLAAALLAELFVPNPPAEYAPAPVSQVSLNQTAAGDGTNSDLVMLGKLELALVAVPVLIGAVAASWRRASLVGNLWLFSAVVSAGVASLDLLLGTQISELATGLPFAEGRASGLAIHSNHLGLASAMALPLALAHATAPHRVRRMLGSAAAAVLVVGILASGSRANFVGAVVAVALTLLFLRGAQAKLAIGVIAALMVMLVGSVVVSAAGSQVVTLERIAGESGALESDSRRRDKLDASLSAVMAHGLTGVGFATARDAHNLYLQMLQAGGILGLTAFAVFACGAVRLGWRLSREPRAPPDSARLAAALTVSLLVWLTTGLVQNAVNDRYIVVPFGVLLGLSLAVNRQRSSLPPSAEPSHGGVPLHTRRMATEAT